MASAPREAAGKHHQDEAKRVPYADANAGRQRPGPGRRSARAGHSRLAQELTLCGRQAELAKLRH